MSHKNAKRIRAALWKFCRQTTVPTDDLASDMGVPVYTARTRPFSRLAGRISTTYPAKYSTLHKRSRYQRVKQIALRYGVKTKGEISGLFLIEGDYL